MKAVHLIATRAAEFPPKCQAFQVSAAGTAAAFTATAEAFWAAEQASDWAREASLSREELRCRSKMKVTWPPDLMQMQEKVEVVFGRANRAQCAILREIFGPLPLRKIRLSPSWLKWNSGTIPKLAQGMYKEGVFDALPVLADALEEAGCSHADVLYHCRMDGEHFRGCWIVDWVLGKE
jgi:hypothetical protein